MTVIDAVIFGISIGMGLLSIALGVFAIWLSYKFASDSSKALSDVQKLAQDTRTLVEANLDQQKSFSGKMLDSIIEQNKFGSPSPDNSKQDVVSKELDDRLQVYLKEVEGKLVASIEHEVRQLSLNSNVDVNTILDVVRKDIGALSESKDSISSIYSPPKFLQNALRHYKKFPAHFVLLYAILTTNSNSIDELLNLPEEYGLPDEIESGIVNLLGDGILVGDNTHFQVDNSLLEHLNIFFKRNKELIEQLQSNYVIKSESGITNVERLMGKQFVI